MFCYLKQPLKKYFKLKSIIKFIEFILTHLVNWSTAALLMQYAKTPGKLLVPVTEETLTIEPMIRMLKFVI